MNTYTRALIKWPGGKSKEYKYIKNLIPRNINTYIEPFFGGGGVFFSHKPEKAIINDINNNLMSFYQLIKKQDSSFKNNLIQIANDWDNTNIIARMTFDVIKDYKNKFTTEKIQEIVEKLRRKKNIPKLINGQDAFWQLLAFSLNDKFKRIEKLEIRSGIFKEKDFFDQVAAVVKGNYYYYLRDKFKPGSKEQEIAQFYFIREY